MYAYFASVVEGEERGIHACKVQTDTGAMKTLSFTKDEVTPMFLAAHPNGKSLYAVFSERIGDERKGYVASYAIDPETGALNELSRGDSGGGVPCYIGFDHTGAHIFVANYFGATTSVFPIQSDGSLGPATDIRKYGDDEQSHKEAMLHCAIASPCNEYVFVADLGNDQIIVYQFDVQTGQLAPHGHVELPSGSGPRHLAVHQNEKIIYSINEVNSTLSAFHWDANTGELKLFQTESIIPEHTVPEDYTPRNTGSDIHIHPKGHILYGSNRGHNSLAVFHIDAETGKLTKEGYQPAEGAIPRSFALHSEGRLALIVNEGTDAALTFTIDERTGMMKHTGYEHRVPKAISVAVVEL